MTETYRQGDVLLVAVARRPGGQRKRWTVTKDGRLILARGEVTGHAHTVAAHDAELFESDGQLFLRVAADNTAVTHEEHAPLNLPRGDYRVVIQREYEPKTLPRPVAD